MNKRNLFEEIRQGIEALSCARKAEITLRTETAKFKPAATLSSQKRDAIEQPELQLKSTDLSKGYMAMGQDSDRERDAFAWCEAVVGDVKG